jgi:hypothetical protein
LGLSDIDKNPEKFGYRSKGIASNQARYGHGHMDWETNSYSMDQAVLDAKFVIDEFLKDSIFKHTPLTFGLPYILSLSDKPNDILNVILNNDTSVWANNEDFNTYIQNLSNTHRKKYIDQILKL